MIASEVFFRKGVVHSGPSNFLGMTVAGYQRRRTGVLFCSGFVATDGTVLDLEEGPQNERVVKDDQERDLVQNSIQVRRCAYV